MEDTGPSSSNGSGYSKQSASRFPFERRVEDVQEPGLPKLRYLDYLRYLWEEGNGQAVSVLTYAGDGDGIPRSR